MQYVVPELEIISNWFKTQIFFAFIHFGANREHKNHIFYFKFVEAQCPYVYALQNIQSPRQPIVGQRPWEEKWQGKNILEAMLPHSDSLDPSFAVTAH